MRRPSLSSWPVLLLLLLLLLVERADSVNRVNKHDKVDPGEVAEAAFERGAQWWVRRVWTTACPRIWGMAWAMLGQESAALEAICPTRTRFGVSVVNAGSRAWRTGRGKARAGRWRSGSARCVMLKFKLKTPTTK